MGCSSTTPSLTSHYPFTTAYHSDSLANPVISYLGLSGSSTQLFSSPPSFCLHLSGLIWLSFSLGLFRVCPLLFSPKSCK